MSKDDKKNLTAECPCLTCPNSMQGDKRPGDEECNSCIPYEKWRNEYPCRKCSTAIDGHRDDYNDETCHPCVAHNKWFKKNTELWIREDQQRSCSRRTNCCAI